MKIILKLSMIIFIVLALLGSFIGQQTEFIMATTIFGIMGFLLTAGYLIYENLKR